MGNVQRTVRKKRSMTEKGIEDKNSERVFMTSDLMYIGSCIEVYAMDFNK